jgi:hypothetical protein
VPLEQLLIGIRIAVEQELRPVALLAQLQPGALQGRFTGIDARIRQRYGHDENDSGFC